MHRMLLHAGVTLSLLLGLPAAHAASVTSDQAATLETQVRDWLSGLMGAGAKLPERPVTITAAGDHFDVVATLAGMGMPGRAASIVMRGAARPLDGGRWSIDDVKADTPMAITIDTPLPPPDGGPSKPGAQKPSAQKPSAQKLGMPKPDVPTPDVPSVPIHYTITVNGQAGHIVWDPSFATQSTWSSAAQSVTVHAEDGPFPHDSTFGPVTSTATLQANGPDRVDLSTDGTIDNYRIGGGATPGASAITLQRLQVSSSAIGVSRAKATAMLQALGSVPASPDGTPRPLPPEAQRMVLDALQDIASAVSLDETVGGVEMDIQNTHVVLGGMTMGFNAKSDNGLLQAALHLGMAGLSLPTLNLGGLEALIPEKVALRPVVSGVSTAALLAMAREKTEGHPPGQAEVMALLSHEGVSAGLESVIIAIGSTVITGHGTVSMAGPQQVAGTAQVVAENFDALMQKVSGIPAAAQATPVLIMAKGIGRTVGNTIVWDIAYQDGKVLVNNVDLAAMAGGGAGAGAGQRRPPNRQPMRQ